MVTLVTGGTRSGKSRWAMTQARTLSASPVYVATSRVLDAEYRARVERHRADRGDEWTTLEEDVAIDSLALDGRVVVVDCLTLWLTNLILDAKDDAETALKQARQQLDRLMARPAIWFLVSNELGLGLHADTELGRRFVDLQGFVNQHVAAAADRVVLMVAGLPLWVKGKP